MYQKLRELRREDISVYIFEYDRRFSIYGDEFIFYDYNNPLDLPEGVAPRSFDIVVADPPYLSEECLRKTSETIQFLTRGKILLCTGRCHLHVLSEPLSGAGFRSSQRSWNGILSLPLTA